MQNQLMTVPALYEFLGGTVGRNALYDLINAGHIKATTINGRRVIKHTEAQRFADLLSQPHPLVLRSLTGKPLITKAP